MAAYCVNNQPQNNGDHEVHRQGCPWWPADRRSLGEHPNCHSAVAMAKVFYGQANGCAHCSKECHTS
jgi:hypothetical protein